jgi:uncharacterized 2Fe-2S/4Fe-4S cluster protein (DUF4445 family)
MKQFKITFRPSGKIVTVDDGVNLLDAAARAGIHIVSACGGKGTCKKCIVEIADNEDVLACQYKINSNLVVEIPPHSIEEQTRILEDGLEKTGSVEPDIYKKYLHIAVGERIFGLAADIGTTTVVVKLLDMKSGDRIATESAMNPQSKFGDDVISRIHFAGLRDGLTELHNSIIGCFNELIGKLCKKTGIDRKEIFEVCIVGNTTMNHLFLKMPVKGLGISPYKAYNVNAQQLYPAEAGIQINPKGNIYAAANIQSFLGSDTTAAALACGIGQTDKKTLLVDIGTNGEVVLGNKTKLLAASCAAGPAFEGARISRGSRAQNGAIEAVELKEDDLSVKIIGDTTAKSICGSGLIDAAAVLAELCIIDSSGRIVHPKNISAKISKRIVEENGQPAVLLAKGKKDILLTQKDIRQLQLAKAAIRAGIMILQNKMGIKDNQIEQVFLAGAFGNYIRKENALRIGLLPKLPLERIHFIGNAACSGAEMMLLSNKQRTYASELAKRIEHIETAKEKDFEQIFTSQMGF